jgi:hypothetical protein
MKYVVTTIALMCMFGGCAAAYEPPSYPQDAACLQSIAVSIASDGVGGGPIELTFDLTLRKPLDEQRKLWVYLEKGGLVYHAQVVDPGDTGSWLAGRNITLGPYAVKVPADLAPGEYAVRAGMYKERVTGSAKLTLSPSPQPSPARGEGAVVITTGCFTDKYGTPHYWHINKAHTLIWDGEPFIPAGGMFIYDRDWNLVKAQIDLLKRYGVKNIYLHLGVNQPYVWKGYSDDDYRFFQQTIDYLDANGFTYGIEFQALEAKGPGFSYPGGLGVGHVKTSGTVRVEAKEPTSAVYLVVDEATGRAVTSGEARIVDGKFLEADVTVPKGADYRVIFQADRAGPDGFVMYYWDDKYQTYVKKVRDHYSKVKLGPGFRFLVDPLWNEMNTSHDFIPSAPAFAEQFTRWLEERYGTIEKLNDAWKAVDGGWPTFSAAGYTISIERVEDRKTGKLVQFAYSRSAKRFYTMEACSSQFNYDVREFIGRSLLSYCNDIADVFKQMNDVPVIYKCFSDVDWWHINDTGLASGHDGLGMESYGTGEPMLLFMAIHAFGECEQARKTTWLIVTETGEGNHQDVSLSRNKPIGYSDRLGTMYANYNALISAGAKGVYQYNMIGGRGMQEPWSDSISRDPRQLEWLATYDRILANAAKLVDYKPTVYYRYPAHFRPCSMELWSDPCNDFANMGGWWWREPVERAQNNVWILPSFSLRPETPMFIVNLENKPATERFAEEVTSAVEEGKRLTVIGWRKDLGTIPAIDKYYTDRFAENERGRRFQILKPTPTSRVLNRTWNGHVWNLIDGNLQINSEEVFGKHGYQPQDLAFGPERVIDPYDGVFSELLGVRLLDLGPDMSWLSFNDGGTPVTVITARNGRHEFTLPASRFATYSHASGASAGERQGDRVRIALESPNMTLVKAKFDWGPDGIMVDSLDSKDTVIVRGLSPNEAAPAPLDGPMFAEPWERAKNVPESERKEIEESLARATSGNKSTPLRLAAALDRAENLFYELKTPFIWIEGESAKSHNWNYSSLGALPKLSGNAFLGLETAVEPPRDTGWYASYELYPTREGVYQLWVRENYLSFCSPCAFRIDSGQWVKVPNTLVPHDISVIAHYNAVEDSRQVFAWYHYGSVRLAPGKHVLTIKVDERRPKGTVLTMAEDRPYAKLVDCILLTQRGFVPDGKRKPYYLLDSPSPLPSPARGEGVVTAQPGTLPVGEGVGTVLGENLLPNPSMELDSNGDGKCDGWRPSEDTGLDWTKPDWQNIRMEGLFGIEGVMRSSYAQLRSLKIVGGEKERMWITEPIKTGPSERFLASGWIRTSDTATDSFIRVQWTDWRGQVLHSEVLRPEKPSIEWQEVRSVLTRPKRASAAVFQCVTAAGSKGSAWFDDVVLAASAEQRTISTGR